MRYTQAGLLTQTFKRTSPSSRNKHPSDIAERHSANTALRRLTKMSRIELESERDDLKQRIEELDRILASAEALDKIGRAHV